MPTITYDKKDLLNLIGKKLSDEQLEEVIHLMKTNVEDKNEKEITIELTPDRPDLFGIEGLARSVKHYLGLQMGLKKYAVDSPKLQVKASYLPYRPYLAAAVIKNVVITDAFIKSLMNIQDVLTDTIGRKRKKVAIGIHDFDKIISNINYIEVNPSEKIVPLDTNEEMTLAEALEKIPKGKEYGHILSGLKKFPVWTDAKGIFSFPPIINAEKTRVTEKTKSILVELTGTDKEAVLQTLNIIVTNFAERRCIIESVKIFLGEKSEVTPNLNSSFMDVGVDEINKLIGLDLKKSDVIDALSRMGYDVTENKGVLRVFVPAYRTDILHKVDIMEDVAIGYGFNNFISHLPSIATVGKSHAVEKLSSKIRQLLVGYGFQEIIRPVLTNQKNLFDKMNAKHENVIELENPVSEEYVCLRNWLLPSLMGVLSANKHVEYPQNIFEVGDVVVPDNNEETMSKTIRKVAFIISHSKAGYAEVKGLVESMLKQMDVSYSFKENSSGTFLEGRQAVVVSGEKIIGIIGEISPAVLEQWGLEMPCSAFEINLEGL
ncbi:MAG: phenylalanine--tRNA ligase subunit beta [Candidatus Aenigmarchaeota archaeon]|nr:phenylalanine--tRNA ligase subunit beta [Candidatus Aenigmarchaeota archaeon]